MNPICLKTKGNIGKTVQNALHAILPTDSHDCFRQFLVFLLCHIFFTENQSCWMTSCNSFNSCQKILLTQFPVGNTKNIKHTHNHSEPAVSLRRTYPYTSFQSCGHHQSQTARHLLRHHLLFPCTCFRDHRCL